MRSGSSLLVVAALVAILAARPGSAAAATPRVEVPGAATSIEVSAASGELEDARVVVRGVAGALSVHLAAGAPPLLRQGLSVLRLESTLVAGRAVADPLPPLERRANVRAGEDVTLILRFRVPDATPAGRYESRLVFAAAGHIVATVPVLLRVFGVQLQARDDPNAFRTLFLLKPHGLRRLGRAAHAFQRRD
jgi:hypothetical protein